MNKVLNNYNKSKRINGTTKGKIGTVLHLMDKNKERLSSIFSLRKNMVEVLWFAK